MSGHFLITGQMGLQLKSININYPVENQNKVNSIQSDFIKILLYFQQLNLLFYQNFYPFKLEVLKLVDDTKGIFLGHGRIIG